jgi:hypothetical protein
VVRVAKNLNYERKSRYILTVRAEDCAGGLLLLNSGEDSTVRFDTASIVITVADINDNPPTFLDSPYLAYVMENVIPPPNGYVLTVRAYDADTPPYNGQVRYFIKEGDADLFRINASSGEITLLRAVDREAQAEYILTLVAMDTGEYLDYISFVNEIFILQLDSVVEVNFRLISLDGTGRQNMYVLSARRYTMYLVQIISARQMYMNFSLLSVF